MPFGFVAALWTTVDASFACCNWNCADCTRTPTTPGTVAFAVTTTVDGFESWWR
jgi:hypothetical protein